ncbi:MAG: hypothetical protein QXR31_01440 [Zestosphaera sp.]
MEKECEGMYALLSIVVIGIILFFIIKEIKQKTKITQITRDEQGRIVEIVEKVI